jgi:hypothetical protein
MFEDTTLVWLRMRAISHAALLYPRCFAGPTHFRGVFAPRYLTFDEDMGPISVRRCNVRPSAPSWVPRERFPWSAAFSSKPVRSTQPSRFHVTVSFMASWPLFQRAVFLAVWLYATALKPCFHCSSYKSPFKLLINIPRYLTPLPGCC